MKDDFLVASNGLHSSIEKFGDGFIIVYESNSKIRRVIYDASYETVTNSDKELNN